MKISYIVSIALGIITGVLMPIIVESTSLTYTLGKYSRTSLVVIDVIFYLIVGGIIFFLLDKDITKVKLIKLGIFLISAFVGYWLGILFVIWRAFDGKGF